MKRKLTFIYPFFSLVLLASLFISYAGGRDDAYAGAPNDSTCAECHGGGDPTGTVSLTNVPTRFIAGQTYALTLSIQHAAAIRGGFQIVATNGTTNAMVGTFTSATGMRLNNISRLTQSTPRNFSGGNVSWTFNWTAPTSNPPTNVVFYYVGNAVNGDGGTSGDAVFTSNSSTTLPIELVNFEAKKGAEKTINLTWTTASEQNNRLFDVERSADNQKFETIGRLKGNGTSTAAHTYQLSDDVTEIPTNIVYYRLHQIDFNGTSTYSKTISVALTSKVTFKIYPTLAKRGDVLRLETTENGRIDVMDMTGKIVKTVQQSPQVGNQNTTETVNIPTSDLPTGRYFVRSLGNGLLQTARFVVF